MVSYRRCSKFAVGNLFICLFMALIRIFTLPNDNQTAAGDNADYCLVLTRQVLGLAVLSRSHRTANIVINS